MEVVVVVVVVVVVESVKGGFSSSWLVDLRGCKCELQDQPLQEEARSTATARADPDLVCFASSTNEIHAHAHQPYIIGQKAVRETGTH